MAVDAEVGADRSLLAYAALVGCVFIAQDSLIYFPNMGREIAATPARVGLPYEDVSIRTEDGETLHAWWVPARERARRGAALSRQRRQHLAPHSTTRACSDRLGYSTLLVDYRGYGQSTGTPSEEGTYRDADGELALAHRQRTASRERDIVLFGESLGGAVAAGSRRASTPRALVLASTFTSVPDLGAEVYPFLPVRLLSRYQVQHARCARTREGAGAGRAQPRATTSFRTRTARRSYAAAREPKPFLELARRAQRRLRLHAAGVGEGARALSSSETLRKRQHGESVSRCAGRSSALHPAR